MNKLKLSKLINDLCSGNTVTWLSRQTGIDAQRLRSYARGSNTPSVESLSAIASYMGITVDGLVADLEDVQPSMRERVGAYDCTLTQARKVADCLSKPEQMKLIQYLVERVAV